MEGKDTMAVIRIAGKQFKVAEGSEISVPKLADAKAAVEVLLVAANSKVILGKPVVTGAAVKYSIIKELEKGDKVKGFKYKAKSRYRKRFGFRESFTRIKIEKITV